MDFLTYVMWNDTDGHHEEYRFHYTLEDAKWFSDHKAENLKKKAEKGEIDGFSVLIYELTNY